MGRKKMLGQLSHRREGNLSAGTKTKIDEQPSLVGQEGALAQREKRVEGKQVKEVTSAEKKTGKKGGPAILPHRKRGVREDTPEMQETMNRGEKRPNVRWAN